MPSTVTSYYTFTAGTKARSSQVNVNFSNYRGDLLPINENTASASDMTHYMGQADHRWAFGFMGNLDLKSSTTGAGLVLRGDIADTAGAFLFQINSTTVGKVKATGIDGTYLIPGSVGDTQLTTTVRCLNSVDFTAAGAWTVPAGIFNIQVLMCGSGGGGGGGGGASGAFNGGGGGGGAGSIPMICNLAVTPAEVLSITAGLQANGGGPGTDAGAAGTTGTAGNLSKISRAGTILMKVAGGAAGSPGVWGGGTKFGGDGGGGAVGGTAGANGVTGGALIAFYGGIYGGGGGGGGGDTGDGGNGADSAYGIGGTGGSVNNAGMGGGGGAGFGDGGNGANSNGGNGASGAQYGGGGGGGGGNDHAGGHVNGGSGGAGASGLVRIFYVK